MYREYGIQGRWPSPDPAGVLAVNPANPQSWNRYAYVLNNPNIFVDPLGLRNVIDYRQLWGGGGWGYLLQISLAIQASSGGFGSGWNEFDSLEFALTPTGSHLEPNPDYTQCMNMSPGDCNRTPATISVPEFGNLGAWDPFPQGPQNPTPQPNPSNQQQKPNPQSPTPPPPSPPKPQPKPPSLLSRACSALPFVGVFNAGAAGGAASIYLGGGVTTLGVGADVGGLALISPAAPIFVGVVGVVGLSVIGCRIAGY